MLRVMRHVALGLRSLHAKQLVHLDIKPANIFIKTEDLPTTPVMGFSSSSLQFDGEGECADMAVDSPANRGGGEGGIGAVTIPRTPAHPPETSHKEKLYKIGDLGLVTVSDGPLPLW